MCGIVGYIGHRDAYSVLINGLKRLEYRGYDSAGVAIVDDNGEINICKCKGKVVMTEEHSLNRCTSGSIGIGHTRWATHGAPNDTNAHPHSSQSGDLVLIHNGIIENYAILKEALIEYGYTFNSSTDSEVLINLIGVRVTQRSVLLEAAVRTH